MSETDNNYEVIIIGAGPAGLTAGIYTARSGLRTLILEGKFTGGLMAEAPHVENYPAFQDGLSGFELANRMVTQAKKFGVQINCPEKVIELQFKENSKIVKTRKSTYNAKAVILALGCEYRKLGISGEEKFRGRGVSYCATCDGPYYKNKRVLVVGGGNSAAATAIYLSSLASSVKMIHRMDVLRADDFLVKVLREKKVEVSFNTVVREIAGDTMVGEVTLEDVRTGYKRMDEVDGIFIQIGEKPCSGIAQDAGVETDKERYIMADYRQRTNVMGVYAAGDVTNCPVKQVGTAVGQGIIAAVESFAYIRRPYYCDYIE